MRQAFLTLSLLKVSRLVIIFRDTKKDEVAPIFLKVAASCSLTLRNSERKIILMFNLGEFRKKNNSDVSFICFRSKCHNYDSPFSLCKLTYFTSYLGTLTFHKLQTIFFSEYPHSVEQFTTIFAKISANLYNFFNPVQLEYLPLIFKVTKRQKHMLHLKRNNIFGILESRWMIWHI